MIRAVSDSDSFTPKNFTSENLTSGKFDAEKLRRKRRIFRTGEEITFEGRQGKKPENPFRTETF
jgi:hypothetical protein